MVLIQQRCTRSSPSRFSSFTVFNFISSSSSERCQTIATAIPQTLWARCLKTDKMRDYFESTFSELLIKPFAVYAFTKLLFIHVNLEAFKCIIT